MKKPGWLVWLALGSVTQTYNFDATPPAKMPAGWVAVAGRPGVTSRWEVLKDATAPSPPNVLGQLSKRQISNQSRLAILNKVNATDGEVSVKMKPIDGRDGRGGGLVWRYRDPDNYYLLQADARTNQVVVCRMEGGKRIPLEIKEARRQTFAVTHPVPAGLWTMVKIQFRGPLFSVFINHRRLFQVQDWTFRENGKVGLWTENDAVTYFDDFNVAIKR